MKNFCKLFSMGGGGKINTRTSKGLLSLMLITTAFASCTNESEDDFRQLLGNNLDIQVGIQETANSRAVITGNNLVDGSQVGVTVVDATGTAYQDQDYNNVCYTAATTDGKQQWTPSKDVTLSGEPATLYAYYPWTDGVDVSAIPVDMTAADQTDWMYATPVEGLNDANATAQVKLHHALANVKLTIYKESYSGAGEVTALSIQSDGAATGGTLNAKTGTFTETVNDGQAITRTVTYTLTDKASATPFDCMVVPTGTNAAMTVTVTVDGHTYSSTTAALTLAKATAYNLALKLTSTGLSVTSVSLTDWDEEPLPDADFEPVQDEMVNAYSDWVKVIYKVDDASQPVPLFCNYEEEVDGELFRAFDISSVAKLAVQENVDARSESQPVEVEPALNHQFTSSGEHAVYIKFQDMSRIPMYSFLMVSALIDFELPESIKTIDIGAFTMCQNLQEIILPDNVEYLVGVEDEKEPEPMGPFAGCINATKVVLSKNLKEIGSGSFFYCMNLAGKVEIPNSVTRIGTLAFMNTKISEFILGHNVQLIGPGAFDNCTNLEKITSLKTTAPIMESTSYGLTGFGVVASNGTLYVPKGCTAAYSTWMSTSEYFLGCYNWNIQELDE